MRVASAHLDLPCELPPPSNLATNNVSLSVIEPITERPPRKGWPDFFLPVPDPSPNAPLSPPVLVRSHSPRLPRAVKRLRPQPGLKSPQVKETTID